MKTLVPVFTSFRVPPRNVGCQECLHGRFGMLSRFFGRQQSHAGQLGLQFGRLAGDPVDEFRAELAAVSGMFEHRFNPMPELIRNLVGHFSQPEGASLLVESVEVDASSAVRFRNHECHDQSS